MFDSVSITLLHTTFTIEFNMSTLCKKYLEDLIRTWIEDLPCSVKQIEVTPV